MILFLGKITENNCLNLRCNYVAFLIIYLAAVLKICPTQKMLTS